MYKYRYRYKYICKYRCKHKHKLGVQKGHFSCTLAASLRPKAAPAGGGLRRKGAD